MKSSGTEFSVVLSVTRRAQERHSSCHRSPAGIFLRALGEAVANRFHNLKYFFFLVCRTYYLVPAKIHIKTNL